MALEQQLPAATAHAGYRITIAGCGPGALDHLTPAARTAIEGAEVLAGASRLLALFPASQAERIVVGSDIPKTLDQLAIHVNRRKVVVLVSGDPGVCSLAQPVIQRFGWESCRVIPGISSVQVAFARLGLDWTDALVISAHHHAPDIDFAPLAGKPRIALLAGNSSTWPWVVELAGHLSQTHNIFVCQDLTLAEERVSRVDSAELAMSKLSPQSVLLFIGKKIRP
jgi:cobalt-precorrin-7 (C5)-methyltransferase